VFALISSSRNAYIINLVITRNQFGVVHTFSQTGIDKIYIASTASRFADLSNAGTNCEVSSRVFYLYRSVAMASIASLLNPEPNDEPPRWPRQNPTSLLQPSRLRDDRSPPPSRQKKQKICKDGPVFTKGSRTRGEIRYPPCEYQDEELAAAHRELQVYPMGSIMHYPRHIPYNSEKKSFLEKTGRESFEGKSPGWSAWWARSFRILILTASF
jgi:hypothetical protein